MFFFFNPILGHDSDIFFLFLIFFFNKFLYDDENNTEGV